MYDVEGMGGIDSVFTQFLPLKHFVLHLSDI